MLGVVAKGAGTPGKKNSPVWRTRRRYFKLRNVDHVLKMLYTKDNETIFWPLIANEYRYIVYKFEINWTLFTGSKNQSPKTDSFVRT